MDISNKTLQAWFELSTFPAVITDANWNIIQLNQSFRDYFSLKDSGIDLRSLKDLVDIVDPASLIKGASSSFSNLGSSFIVPMNAKPGYILRVYQSGDQSDRLYLGLIETESNQNASQLRKELNEAIESNKLKTAFLANMSHEIRTPLNTIIGFSELILEEELSKQEVHNLVEMISTSGKSLLQLVEDIIDISRIETGQIRINKTEVRIEPILQEAFMVFEAELKKRSDRSEVELRLGNTLQGCSFVIADPFRFKQILNNLLSNAIKFTKSGYIEFGFLVGVQGLVQFYVKDTGVGIEPLMSSKVFQRFGQINQPGIQNREGSGLGLAISKQLVELMGGQIWFDSQPGKGTTFYFTLPAYSSSPYDQRGLPNPLYHWGDQIFLIVDDVEANYLFLRSIFKSSGALLLWAKNGEEAIRYCRSNPDISLVLMDIQMPQTDGYQATSAIKALNPLLPVIAQTAFADTDSKNKALKAGCDDFITKPINKHELFSLIEKFVRK